MPALCEGHAVGRQGDVAGVDPGEVEQRDGVDEGKQVVDLEGEVAGEAREVGRGRTAVHDRRSPGARRSIGTKSSRLLARDPNAARLGQREAFERDGVERDEDARAAHRNRGDLRAQGEADRLEEPGCQGQGEGVVRSPVEEAARGSEGVLAREGG